MKFSTVMHLDMHSAPRQPLKFPDFLKIPDDRRPHLKNRKFTYMTDGREICHDDAT